MGWANTFYPPAAGDTCCGSFAASGDGGDGPAGGGGRHKPAAAAGMLPWALGLVILSRQTFWRLAKSATQEGQRGAGTQQKISDKTIS